jgi:hypothetical protein
MIAAVRKTLVTTDERGNEFTTPLITESNDSCLQGKTLRRHVPNTHRCRMRSPHSPSLFGNGRGRR